MLMNRDLVLFIFCLIFIAWLMWWFIWSIWLEDYFLYGDFNKEKKSDLTPYQQEKLDELMQYVHEELQHIDELRQQMDESNKGDND